MPLSYVELHGFWVRGLRNGNWRLLSFMERGFYMAVLFYARGRGRIVNQRLVSMALRLVDKLKSTAKDKILQAGLKRVKAMLPKCKELGVLGWALGLKEWVKEEGFILWFGLSAKPELGSGSGLHISRVSI